MSDTRITRNDRIYPIDAKVGLVFNRDIESNILHANVKFSFFPFDVTSYQWDYLLSASNYNYLNSILYNYIPFALCYSPGRHTSYEDEDADFQEITDWNFAGMSSTYECLNSEKIFISDLKDSAVQHCRPYSDEWFETNPLGRRMNFTYALNGNLYMYHDILETNVNKDIQGIIEDLPDYRSRFQIWSPDNMIASDTANKVEFSTDIDLSEYHGDNTFLLLAASPYTNIIYSEYITILEETTPQWTYVYEYEQGSMNFYDSEHKVNVTESSSSQTSVTLSVSNNSDKNWVSSQPVITFKVKRKLVQQ